MRVGVTSNPRSMVFDRSPSFNGFDNFNYGLAPDAVGTVRATYTVPAGKVALVIVHRLRVARTTAAGTPGRASAFLTVGGFIVGPELVPAQNTAGNDDKMDGLGEFIYLTAGQTITYTTYDPSTTGTCDFWGYVAIEEMNA